MGVRWLLTPHGSPLTSESIGPLISDDLRSWAAGFVKRPHSKEGPLVEEEAPRRTKIEVLHSSTWKIPIPDDPMEVMRNTTKALAFVSLLLTTGYLGESYIALEELNALDRHQGPNQRTPFRAACP